MEKGLSSPVEALHEVLGHYLILSESKRRWPKPGAVIERLSQKTRDVLARLKSSHLSKARNEYVMGLLGEESAHRTAERDGWLAHQRWENGRRSRERALFDLKRRPAWVDRLVG